MLHSICKEGSITSEFYINMFANDFFNVVEESLPDYIIWILNNTFQNVALRTKGHLVRKGITTMSGQRFKKE